VKTFGTCDKNCALEGQSVVCKEAEDAWTASAEFIEGTSKKVTGHAVTFREAPEGSKAV
jgi:hypothetical protein